MAKEFYHIVKTADDSMTTYQVVDTDRADNGAICKALTEAAQDVWQYITTTPGAYTAAQLALGKNIMPLSLREGKKLPKELSYISVECGTFKCGIGMKVYPNRDNFDTLFAILAEFEKMAHININERAMFTARMELGELVCEARVILPADIKAICQLCGENLNYPCLQYPALDLDRQCIVATDGSMMVAKKVTVASLHYEEKVPETFYLPKEVERMQGEVTVQLFEHGCAVIDQNGVIAEVEHEMTYPKWYSVWPKYRGGMTIVDSKAMTKVVKCAANGLPERGRGENEVLLLTHYPASANLSIFGYVFNIIEERPTEQCVPDCIATDEVAWRVPVNAKRLLTVLALKPKLMWAGYNKQSTLPDRIVLEDMQADMAVMIKDYINDDLADALQKTNKEFILTSDRGLYHCYGDDGWLLERLETKEDVRGMKEEGRRKKEDVSQSSTLNPEPLTVNHEPSAIKHQPSYNHEPSTLNPEPLTVNHEPELSLSDRLRIALLNILATTSKVA